MLNNIGGGNGFRTVAFFGSCCRQLDIDFLALICKRLLGFGFSSHEILELVQLKSQ